MNFLLNILFILSLLILMNFIDAFILYISILKIKFIYKFYKLYLNLKSKKIVAINSISKIILNIYFLLISLILCNEIIFQIDIFEIFISLYFNNIYIQDFNSLSINFLNQSSFLLWMLTIYFIYFHIKYIYDKIDSFSKKIAIYILKFLCLYDYLYIKESTKDFENYFYKVYKSEQKFKFELFKKIIFIMFILLIFLLYYLSVKELLYLSSKYLDYFDSLVFDFLIFFSSSSIFIIVYRKKLKKIKSFYLIICLFFILKNNVILINNIIFESLILSKYFFESIIDYLYFQKTKIIYTILVIIPIYYLIKNRFNNFVFCISKFIINIFYDKKSKAYLHINFKENKTFFLDLKTYPKEIFFARFLLLILILLLLNLVYEYIFERYILIFLILEIESFNYEKIFSSIYILYNSFISVYDSFIATILNNNAIFIKIANIFNEVNLNKIDYLFLISIPTISIFLYLFFILKKVFHKNKKNEIKDKKPENNKNLYEIFFGGESFTKPLNENEVEKFINKFLPKNKIDDYYSSFYKIVIFIFSTLIILIIFSLNTLLLPIQTINYEEVLNICLILIKEEYFSIFVITLIFSITRKILIDILVIIFSFTKDIIYFLIIGFVKLITNFISFILNNLIYDFFKFIILSNPIYDFFVFLYRYKLKKIYRKENNYYKTISNLKKTFIDKFFNFIENIYLKLKGSLSLKIKIKNSNLTFEETYSEITNVKNTFFELNIFIVAILYVLYLLGITSSYYLFNNKKMVDEIAISYIKETYPFDRYLVNKNRNEISKIIFAGNDGEFLYYYNYDKVNQICNIDNFFNKNDSSCFRKNGDKIKSNIQIISINDAELINQKETYLNNEINTLDNILSNRNDNTNTLNNLNINIELNSSKTQKLLYCDLNSTKSYFLNPNSEILIANQNSKNILFYPREAKSFENEKVTCFKDKKELCELVKIDCKDMSMFNKNWWHFEDIPPFTYEYKRLEIKEQK